MNVVTATAIEDRPTANLAAQVGRPKNIQEETRMSEMDSTTRPALALLPELAAAFALFAKAETCGIETAHLAAIELPATPCPAFCEKTSTDHTYEPWDRGVVSREHEKTFLDNAMGCVQVSVMEHVSVDGVTYAEPEVYARLTGGCFFGGPADTTTYADALASAARLAVELTGKAVATNV